MIIIFMMMIILMTPLLLLSILNNVLCFVVFLQDYKTFSNPPNLNFILNIPSHKLCKISLSNDFTCILRSL